MIVRIAAWMSTFACAVIILSFGMWAADEGKGGSSTQVAKINDAFSTPAPSPQSEAEREKAHSAMREHIDDVDDVLLSPFAGVVTSDNDWAKRMVPAVIGLLLYGVLFRLLVAYIPK
jgi:hypothetical protein